jgi:hypothetical protein
MRPQLLTFASLGQRLLDGYLAHVRAERRTVFLVGAKSTDPTSLRARLRGDLETRSYVSRFRVLYPEELFDDLLSGKFGERFDLLRLENLLAEGVDAVVILLESAGSIAELGAFCNHRKLAEKLVVVVQEEHRRDHSFIMLGPVRQVRERNRQAVIFADFESSPTAELGLGIRRAITSLGGRGPGPTNVNNPIQGSDLFLGALFVVDDLAVDGAAAILHGLSRKSLGHRRVVARVALRLLEQDGLVAQGRGRFSMTARGVTYLRERIRRTPRRSAIWRELDRLRVDFLNQSLRRAVKLV